jgi:hypothetical protein
VDSFTGMMKNITQKLLSILLVEKLLLYYIHKFTFSGIIINGIGGAGKTTIFMKFIELVSHLGMDYAIVTPTACAAQLYREEKEQT